MEEEDEGTLPFGVLISHRREFYSLGTFDLIWNQSQSVDFYLNKPDLLWPYHPECIRSLGKDQTEQSVPIFR